MDQCSATDLCKVLDKATYIQYKVKDGKPGLGYLSGDGKCAWVPIAAAGKPQPGDMNFVVYITVQNQSSVDLSGSLPPLDQGKWTTPLSFPIKSGNIAEGTVEDMRGIKGYPGIKMTVTGREGEYNFTFQCLPVSENEFKLEEGGVKVVGLKTMTSFQPSSGSPLRCNLIIEDQ